MQRAETITKTDGEKSRTGGNMKSITKDKAIADTTEYLQFRLDESASRAAFLAEAETTASDYVNIKYSKMFTDDEVDEITEEAYNTFCDAL